MIWNGLNSSSIAPVNIIGCSSGSSSKLHLPKEKEKKEEVHVISGQ